MVELQTGASMSATLKAKASLRDENGQNEFLGSWKSVSVTVDDAMDFNFETVPKDKNKEFNVNKLGMDFNIDGQSVSSKKLALETVSVEEMEEPWSNNSERSKLAFNNHVPFKITSDSAPPQGVVHSEDTSITRVPRMLGQFKIEIQCCEVHPSITVMDQTYKSNMQRSLNPKLGALTITSLRKIMSVERNNFSSLKAAKTPDLSTLHISRSIGAKKALSNSALQKQCKSMKSSVLNMEIQESTSSKIAHTTVNEKHAPITPPVKWKTCEASNKDLMKWNPLKHLSPSISENRYRGIEASEIVIQDQICKRENQVYSINSKNSLCEPLTTTIDLSPEVHMTDLEIPLVMESDGNVEKAEAYTEEPEDGLGGSNREKRLYCRPLRRSRTIWPPFYGNMQQFGAGGDMGGGDDDGGGGGDDDGGGGDGDGGGGDDGDGGGGGGGNEVVDEALTVLEEYKVVMESNPQGMELKEIIIQALNGGQVEQAFDTIALFKQLVGSEYEMVQSAEELLEIIFMPLGPNDPKFQQAEGILFILRPIYVIQSQIFTDVQQIVALPDPTPTNSSSESLNS